jgi:ribosomal protein L31
MRKLVFFVSVLLVWACADKNARDFAPKTVVATETTSGEVISFSSQIKPIVVDKCYGCHEGFTGKDWSVFAQFQERATTKFSSSDAEVKLLSKLRGTAGGNRMPQGGPYLSDEQIALFAKWVSQGAKDN